MKFIKNILKFIKEEFFTDYKKESWYYKQMCEHHKCMSDFWHKEYNNISEALFKIIINKDKK